MSATKFVAQWTQRHLIEGPDTCPRTKKLQGCCGHPQHPTTVSSQTFQRTHFRKLTLSTPRQEISVAGGHHLNP